MTNNGHRTKREEVTPSSPRRWPWWLVARSPSQVLLASLGPTILAVILLFTPPNRPYPFWLHSVILLMIVFFVGSAFASVVALRRDPKLRYVTRQRRPVGRSTRHLYAVATLIGAAVVLVVLVVAVVLQAPFAWLALSAAAVVTGLCLGQLSRPLLDLQSAESTNNSN